MTKRRFVEVPREALLAFFNEKGFASFVQGNELVFYREHDREPGLRVKVYSSLTPMASRARGCGQDAIRVVAVYEKGDANFAIYKSPRVYRTGSTEAVLERTLARMREGYARCNEWLKNRDAKLADNRRFLGQGQAR